MSISTNQSSEAPSLWLISIVWFCSNSNHRIYIKDHHARYTNQLKQTTNFQLPNLRDGLELIKFATYSVKDDQSYHLCIMK